jgi:prenyltransferase beta subunit
MLQVARLASLQLGDSRDLVVGFLQQSLTDSGGFRNRAGRSDLYYTVFGLEGLVALQAPVPSGPVTSYIERFGAGEGLDLVHLACLARCWAAVSRDRPEFAPSILENLERYRSSDGAYAQAPNALNGSVYASFLALGAYEDLRATLPDANQLPGALTRLRSRDGGFSNQPDDAHGITTATAAAVLLLRHLEAPLDTHLGMWLLNRCQSSGGFLATPAAPIPDLLSTATALHALSALHVPLGGIREAGLDFIDSLWTNRGGFYGSWADDDVDCEYTYYALLALGHLSLAPV